MTKLNEVYKCEICGNIVNVLHTGAGTLVCCGKNMTLQRENTVDASVEKHVPEIIKTKNGYLVKIGKIEHPMSNEHYIEWIELIVDNVTHIKRLLPNELPHAEFCVDFKGTVKARAYCNLHGLWASENK